MKIVSESLPLLFKATVISSKKVSKYKDLPKSADLWCFDKVGNGHHWHGPEVAVYVTPSGQHYHIFTGH